MIEEWKPIPGYEGSYEVSNQGRVRSLERIDSGGNHRRGKILSPRKNPYRGHLAVLLYKEDRRASQLVHRLVLEAFIGPCPEGMESCHWNDVSDDNRLVNLRWGTRSDNRKDSVRNGTHNNARKTHCAEGHEYTSENTYAHPRGFRACRQCRTNQRLISLAREKEQRRMKREAA